MENIFDGIDLEGCPTASSTPVKAHVNLSFPVFNLMVCVCYCRAIDYYSNHLKTTGNQIFCVWKR